MRVCCLGSASCLAAATVLVSDGQTGPGSAAFRVWSRLGGPEALDLATVCRPERVLQQPGKEGGRSGLSQHLGTKRAQGHRVQIARCVWELEDLRQWHSGLEHRHEAYYWIIVF